MCRRYKAGDTLTQPIYEDYPIVLNPSKTALILIDVWKGMGNHVNELIKQRILRLIDISRNNNIQIVHCPSEKLKWLHPLISIEPNDLLITGYDDFGVELKQRGIDTLLYAGFDTFSCIIDKPCGLVNIKIQHGETFNSIVIRDCTTSKYNETQLTGIHVIEKSFSPSTTISDYFRAFNKTFSIGEIFLPKASGSKKKRKRFKIFAQETALVVASEMVEKDNRYVLNKFDSSKMAPLADFAKKNNVLVIYAPNVVEKNEWQTIRINPESYIVRTKQAYFKLLTQRKIKNVLYAGYSLDAELLFGHVGTRDLYVQNRYRSNPMPNSYFISDFVSLKDAPIDLPGDILKQTIMNYSRTTGNLTLEELFKNIVQGKRSPVRILVQDNYERILRHKKLLLLTGIVSIFVSSFLIIFFILANRLIVFFK